MVDDQAVQLALEAGRVFTPAAPVGESDLFAGRTEQLKTLIHAAGQKGRHAIIYGERGVGKTSIANILALLLNNPNQKNTLAIRVNGDGSDTFSTVMRKLFQEVVISDEKAGFGFAADDETHVSAITERLPDEITPDIARRVLTNLGKSMLIVAIVDEFDRLSPDVSHAFADFLKTLSDFSVRATMVLVGVADSVEELVVGHESVERALVQIQMPRMSPDEIKDIILRGLNRLTMTIADSALDEIALLSQGLPHYAHLLGLHAVHVAGEKGATEINLDVVSGAITAALRDVQQTTQQSYTLAVSSPRKDHLFAEVLLACALAETDEFGYFTPAAVREPMSKLMGRPYDIPSYVRHLSEFTAAARGLVLEKTGSERRYRYRFRNPLLQPYVIMRGLSDGRIGIDDLKELGHIRSDNGS